MDNLVPDTLSRCYSIKLDSDDQLFLRQGTEDTLIATTTVLTEENIYTLRQHGSASNMYCCYVYHHHTSGEGPDDHWQPSAQRLGHPVMSSLGDSTQIEASLHQTLELLAQNALVVPDLRTATYDFNHSRWL
eukprot:scaffold141918_cov15-Prasinocladus_malaysianus.AAC.1